MWRAVDPNRLAARRPCGVRSGVHSQDTGPVCAAPHAT